MGNHLTLRTPYRTAPGATASRLQGAVFANRLAGKNRSNSCFRPRRVVRGRAGVGVPFAPGL